MDTAYFVYPWLSGLFPLFAYYESSCYGHPGTGLWVDMLSFLLSTFLR